MPGRDHRARPGRVAQMGQQGLEEGAIQVRLVVERRARVVAEAGPVGHEHAPASREQARERSHLVSGRYRAERGQQHASAIVRPEQVVAHRDGHAAPRPIEGMISTHDGFRRLVSASLPASPVPTWCESVVAARHPTGHQVPRRAPVLESEKRACPGGD